ncbi:MAG TPA: hypothetical protein VN238_20420 [Solirubrobacteraceae bacterium]|nr:hypothetical protein [Solirubrobacteraceae bacterium]
MAALTDPPPAAPPHQPRVPVQVVAIPGRCWRCNEVTWPIVGVFVPRDGGGRRFLEFPEVAERLAAAVSREQLHELRTGEIKHRRSKVRPEGYLSNGCVDCDAIQGNFPLHEDLITFRAEGGSINDLIVGTLFLPRRQRGARRAAEAS